MSSNARSIVLAKSCSSHCFPPCVCDASEVGKIPKHACCLAMRCNRHILATRAAVPVPSSLRTLAMDPYLRTSDVCRVATCCSSSPVHGSCCVFLAQVFGERAQCCPSFLNIVSSRHLSGRGRRIIRPNVRALADCGGACEPCFRRGSSILVGFTGVSGAACNVCGTCGRVITLSSGPLFTDSVSVPAGVRNNRKF